VNHFSQFKISRQLNLWSKIPLGKLLVSQLVSKLPAFMEPEISLPCLKKPTIWSYPEQGRPVKLNGFCPGCYTQCPYLLYANSRVLQDEMGSIPNVLS